MNGFMRVPIVIIKKVSISIFLFLISFNSFSGHLQGGEITWDCIKSGTDQGKFIFNIKLYRICYVNVALLPSNFSIVNPLYTTYGGISTIYCPKISDTDIFPTCDSGSGVVNCGQSLTLLTAKFGYQQYEYVSQAVQINGVPASNGTDFLISPCCRTSLNNTFSTGYYLRATMYPFIEPTTSLVKSLGSTTGGPTCYDSSPRFAESIAYYGFLNKINHFSIKSFDPECDSMEYLIAAPMINANNAVVWDSGYSTSSPLPNTTMNSSNIPLSINVNNGEASFKTVGGAGKYAIAQEVSSYRYGQKIASVYRDYSMIIGTAATDTFSGMNDTPNISFKNNSALTYNTNYADTFYIGEQVHINIKAEDFDFITTSLLQSVSLRLIADPAIDDAFNPYGCKLSSCAYLDTNTSFWNGSEFKNMTTVMANFKWQLNCEVLDPCMNSLGYNEFYTYNFSVVAMDNICPMPLKKIASFSITVADSIGKEGEMRRIYIDDTLTQLKWVKHKGPNFFAYSLFKSNSINGPYSLLDSITNINDTTYIDTNLSSSISHKYYRIISGNYSNCFSDENTVSSIALSVDDSWKYKSILNWNTLYHQGTPFISGYYIVEADTGSGWMILDTVFHNIISNPSLYSYSDNITTCAYSIDYRITAIDRSNNIEYMSNIDSARYDFVVVSDIRTICENDSIKIGGIWRDTAGIFIDIKQSSLGCDSFVEIELVVNPIYYANDTISICKGESVFLHGKEREKAGMYSKTYQSNLGCDSTVFTTLDLDSINAGIYSSGDTLIAYASGYLYQWVQCPTYFIIPTANNRKFIPISNGAYAVVVDSAGCTDTSVCTEIKTIGVKTQYSRNKLKIYPNPGNDKITFQLSGINESFNIVVYNAYGKLVVVENAKEGFLELNTSEMVDGMYYCKIEKSKGIIYTGKFLVVH